MVTATPRQCGHLPQDCTSWSLGTGKAIQDGWGFQNMAGCRDFLPNMLGLKEGLELQQEMEG